MYFSQGDLPAFGRQYAVWTASKEGYTTSLIVAEKFGKRHFDVMRDIRELKCSKIFHDSNFELVEIIGKNALGGPVNRSYYQITRDGLMFLVMGYTIAMDTPILMPA